MLIRLIIFTISGSSFYINRFAMHKFRAIKRHRLPLSPSSSSSSSSSSSFCPHPRRTCLSTTSSSWFDFSAGTVLLVFLFFSMFMSCSHRTSFSTKHFSTSAASLVVQEQMTPEIPEFLNATEDLYDGVTITMKEPMDSKVFVPLLRASISKWRQQGKKGVWFKLPIAFVNLVEPTVQEGFRYHHAEPDYLMLVYWMPDTPDTLPENASHRVGIGAFVVNNNREVLVVKEKNGGFRGTGVWKLPTGVVNEGEDIIIAAIREVKEETGIETEFVEVLAFRQSHQSFFHKSDLFFVCMLRPRSFDIQTQDSELEAAKWMPIDEYVEQPYNKKHKLFKSVADICKTKSENGTYFGFTATPIASASGKITYLYSNNPDFSKL